MGTFKVDKEELNKLLNKTKEKVEGTIGEDAINVISDIGKAAINVGTEIKDNIKDNYGDKINEIKDDIKESYGEAFNSIKNTIKEETNQIKERININSTKEYINSKVEEKKEQLQVEKQKELERRNEEARIRREELEIKKEEERLKQEELKRKEAEEKLRQEELKRSKEEEKQREQEEAARIREEKRLQEQQRLEKQEEEKRIKKELKSQKKKEWFARNKKKLILAISTPFILVVAFVGLFLYFSIVQNITFFTKEDSIFIGEKLNLDCGFEPQNLIFVPDVEYSFNNSSLVANDSGEYFASSEGDLTISVLYEGKTYDQKTIHIKPIELENYVVYDKEIVMNNSIEVIPEPIPSNATYPDYYMTSNDTDIVKIDGNTLYGVGEGNTSVTVISIDGKIRSTFSVNVKNVQAESIEITNDLSELIYDNSYDVSVKLSPELLSNYEYELISSNSDILKVENNKVEAIDIGEVTLTAKYSESVYCEKEIIVKYPPIEKIEFSSYPEDKLYIDSTYQLEYAYFPEKASGTEFEWSSDNKDIIDVDENGVITAIGVGKATITLTSKNGISNSIEIIVDYPPVEEIEISTFPKNELIVGDTFQLEYTYFPEKANTAEFIWNSDNENILSVSSDGIVTVLDAGEANVSLSSSNGVSDSVVVKTKYPPVDSVEITLYPKYDLEIGKTYKLKYKYLPEKASEAEFSWTSSNKGVVKVDDTGLITAVGVGKARITIKSKNGISNYVEINTNYPPVSKVEITSYPSGNMYVGDTYQLKYKYSPEKVSDNTFEWSSSNTSVVKVNSSGLITAVGAGKALITITSKNDRSNNTTVYVVEKPKTNASTNTAGSSSVTTGSSTSKGSTSKSNSSNKNSGTTSNTNNNVTGSSSKMVWIPATGEKYHRINDCGRMNPNTAQQVTEEWAINNGYSACSKCNP